MVMISPCAGCDAFKLANLLAMLEAISGVVTIIKSAWWYCVFRISPLEGETDHLENANGIDPPTPYRPEDDNESNASIIDEDNANNILWTITGLMMGTLNIVLAAFFFFGLTSVNYIFMVGWCLSFPLYYLIDCILFTFLLKHCTSKERFDRCRSYFISSTIMSFIFNSYLLWVGISVIHWCNCRKDPFRCKFSRDYCHSFHLNFSTRGGEENNVFNDIYHPFDRVSF